MRNGRLVKNASILGLLLTIALAPGIALAGGHKSCGNQGKDAWVGRPVATRQAYLYSGAVADPLCSGCKYTFPIQAVYQCPAVEASQPGSRVRYLQTPPASGLLGGQPYLYHP